MRTFVNENLVQIFKCIGIYVDVADIEFFVKFMRNKAFFALSGFFKGRKKVYCVKCDSLKCK